MKPEFEPEDTNFLPVTPDYDANENPNIEVTEEELSALKDEVDVLHSGDTVKAGEDLLIQKTLSAIMSISKLATDAVAERVRLDASKYIVERVLGPLAKIEKTVDPKLDPVYKALYAAGMINEEPDV